MSRDCIYIIDTFSLMFQVFHAIPAMTGTQGQPTNAVFGMTRDIFAILDRKPTHLVCAFDSPGDGARNLIYPQYKANRAEMPEDLRPQIPLIRQLLEGLRIPILEHASWEADDVIATVTAQAVARGMDVVIVSSDKDARQLLGPTVRMLNCRRNTFLDSAGVMEDWGVRPDQVIDFQSLVGDSVDNIPGVPGIGPKTARSLLEQFGTLDNILANADKVPGKKLSASLVTFADQARMCRELVRLRLDLPMTVDFKSALLCEPDRKALFDLFTLLGFRRYAAQMRETLSESDRSSSESVAESLPVKAISTTAIVSDSASLNSALSQFDSEDMSFVEFSVTGDRIRNLQLTAAIVSNGVQKVAVDLTRTMDAGLTDAVLDRLSSYSGQWVTSSAKPLCHALLVAGKPLPARLFDASIADYLLDAGARSHTLNDIADRHASDAVRNLTGAPLPKARQQTMFDDEETPEEPASSLSRCEQQVQLLTAVTSGLQSGLEQDGLTDLYWRLEEPLIRVLARMEYTGISVDVEELRRQSVTAGTAIEGLTSQIFSQAGRTFNIDSPKQLSTVLFTELQLPVLKKTQTGASTDQEVLEELAQLHPLPAMIIERRHLMKLKGTYLDALPEMVHPRTGRIHATFHQTVASTGRLSSSDPNLQNIPIRTPEGRQVRRAFRAGNPDWVLICADYSQIELRVLAHFSKDQALLDAFREGIDIHTAVASEAFGANVREVTSEQRRIAKAVNFGVIYGQTPWGLAAALGIDKSEAALFIDNYFAKYSGVAQFCEQVLTETARTGYARTILNRRRAISGIRKVTGIVRGMPERTAINTVIQGSAADLIKKAMLDVDQALTAGSLRVSMLLQIHDELVFECHRDDVAPAIALIREQMQSAMALDVPLVVDVTQGPNWLDQLDVE